MAFNCVFLLRAEVEGDVARGAVVFSGIEGGSTAVDLECELEGDSGMQEESALGVGWFVGRGTIGGNRECCVAPYPCLARSSLQKGRKGREAESMVVHAWK